MDLVLEYVYKKIKHEKLIKIFQKYRTDLKIDILHQYILY